MKYTGVFLFVMLLLLVSSGAAAGFIDPFKQPAVRRKRWRILIIGYRVCRLQ